MAATKSKNLDQSYKDTPEHRKNVEHIKKAIEQDGPYSHNIVGLALTDTDRRFGVRAANALIDEFMLYDLYGFVKRRAVRRG